MVATEKYYQLIPEKIHQNIAVIEDILRLEIKGFSGDYFKEVISIIACHVRKDEDTIPLKMTYIKKLIPQGDRYLFALINLGIVVRSGHFIPKVTSYKYKFSVEYKSKFLSFPLHNAKLIRRIKTAHDELSKEAVKSIRGHTEQAKNLKHIKIDEAYKEYVNLNYKAETDQYNSIIGSATRIINGDIFYSIDKTSHRFHSNVTNLSRDLRPFLRVKGEPLVNLDVKNSQLYLSTIILTNPSKVSWLTENPAFALLLQTLKVSLKQDVKHFVKLCVFGEIYEYLMTEFSNEGLTLTRDETKGQVLRILFARNRMPKDEINRKCRQIFKDRFPTVHRIFSKVRGHSKGDKFHSYKRFAILLQRIESYLMLDVILKRIYKELPGTIAITIHDSIMTGILTNNIEAVKAIMEEELTLFVGFRPKIKIEGMEGGESREEKYNTNTVLQPL